MIILGTLEAGALILRNGLARRDIDQMEEDPDTAQESHNAEMFHASYGAGQRVRGFLLSEGIVPEDLPKEPHISEAQRIAEGQIPLDMLPEPSEEQ